MTALDLTFPTPAENLACDEALLDACEEGELGEVLRFWESDRHFVVVGYSNRVETEVNVAACRAKGLPILRRCTGGGTVLQGPGCLNYSLILRIPADGPLTTVAGTNLHVMERHRAAIEALLHQPVSVAGHTDLALDGLKFSGNAQRRRRTTLLFHGTFLLELDLHLVEALLQLPAREPPYRMKRPHTAFLTNLPMSTGLVKEELKNCWGASSRQVVIPAARIDQLKRAKYENPAWIERS